jgi:hypothetical protein
MEMLEDVKIYKVSLLYMDGGSKSHHEVIGVMVGKNQGLKAVEAALNARYEEFEILEATQLHEGDLVSSEYI